MINVQIDPERLAKFEASKLLYGGHGSKFRGEACAMEWAAYLAGEPQSDSPSCVDPIIQRAMIRLNDRLGEADRQLLKPYVIKSLNTAGSHELSIKRGWVAADFAIRKFAPTWLEIAGMTEEAALLRALAKVTKENIEEIGNLTRKVRRAAWDKRDASFASLREKVKDEVTKALADKPDAAAVADAVAVAVADAAAAAVADAAADAAAVAAADAVAVAAAAATAAAAAVAAAAADAAADAAEKRGYYWWRDRIHSKVYEVTKARFEEAYAPTMKRLLPSVLEMLDAMIATTARPTPDFGG